MMSLAKAIPEAVHIEEQQRECMGREDSEIDRTPKITALEDVDRTFDILGRQRFIWTTLDDGEWSLLDDDKKEIVMHPEGEGYVAEIHYADGSSERIIREPIPLEYAQGCSEDYARRHLKIAFADANASWMSENVPATTGQRNYLEKLNAWQDGMTKAEASLEIRKNVAHKNKQRRAMANEPITDKQKYFLQSRGVNISDMTKLQALQAISKLKQNESVKNG